MKISRTDPDIVTLFNGWSRLTTTPQGEMESRPLEGFFRAGTQLVTHYQIRVDGESPVHTLCTQISAREWAGVFLARGTLEQGNVPSGEIPDGSLELRVLRKVGAKWSESIQLRNHSSRSRSAELELELGCPIGDVEFEEEMKTEAKVKVEGCVPEVSWSDGVPGLLYEREFGRRKNAPTQELKRLLGENSPRDGEMIRRGVEIVFSASAQNGCEARFEVEAGEITKIRVILRFAEHSRIDLGIEFAPKIESERDLSSIRSSDERCLWRSTEFRTGNSTVNLILAQAREDLESLVLPVFGNPSEEMSWRVAFNAGIPRYLGIFSRDILTTAWQAAMFSPQCLRGALSRVALYRGVKFDSFRDEEPGRIPHERRLNPKAALGEFNREVYYGDVVSTPFWIVTLAAAFNWTGDRDLLKEHEEVLESCCRWVEERLERGGGFLYYSPSIRDSEQANRNHAWKDSGDAVVDSKGRIRLPPLATVEVQGYCFFALISAAQIELVRGRIGRARELLRKATELKRRFNQAFWMEDQRFFAFALDADGRQVDAITSNVGHCLGTGLIDKDKVEPVVRRLMSPEMFSGWGVRTLSADNPAYDPFSYHRGSVWPVENSTIAAGFAVCGFAEEARKLIRCQFELATLFPGFRLPEAVGGQERTRDCPIPGLYPQANLLQAWSVSAIALEMLVLLGIRPFAQLRTLCVMPGLPEWLPWVEVEDMKVGNATVSLRFWRDRRGKSHWKVTRKRGHLWVIEQPADLSPEATLGRRISEALRSSKPGLKLGLAGGLLAGGAWLWFKHSRPNSGEKAAFLKSSDTLPGFGPLTGEVR